MSYLIIKSIEIVDTNKPNDLWFNADANGIAFVIRSVQLLNDDGTYVKHCSLNKSLIDHLKTLKLEIPKKI